MVTSEHKVSQEGYTGRSNMKLNACGICASSVVPTYNMQHIIQIYLSILLVAKYLVESFQPKAGYGGNVL